jgi:hypothetical protein
VGSNPSRPWTARACALGHPRAYGRARPRPVTPDPTSNATSSNTHELQRSPGSTERRIGCSAARARLVPTKKKNSSGRCRPSGAGPAKRPRRRGRSTVWPPRAACTRTSHGHPEERGDRRPKQERPAARLRAQGVAQGRLEVPHPRGTARDRADRLAGQRSSRFTASAAEIRMPRSQLGDGAERRQAPHRSGRAHA